MDADGSIRLLGHRCEVCGTAGFPRAEHCGSCAAAAPSNATFGASGGTLFGWTAVTAAPPGYEGPVPYGFGIVELDEGIRVLGRLTVSDPSQLAFGQRMGLVLDEVPASGGEPLAVWAFAPEEGA